MSGNQDAAAARRGRIGLILNGHDHEGCDVWHHASHVQDDENEEGQRARTVWHATPWASTTPDRRVNETGLREVTLRSMMGDYGGNAGLLSAWFDFESASWKYDIQMCRLGVQHIWWVIHLLDIVTLSLGATFFLLNMRSSSEGKPGRSSHLTNNIVRVKAVKRD